MEPKTEKMALFIDGANLYATAKSASCACIVSRRVAQCGCQCQGPQGHFVRSFWRRDCLHTCSVGYISNRNDNGWTWPKNRLPPTSENGRQKQVGSENLLSRNPSGSHFMTIPSTRWSKDVSPVGKASNTIAQFALDFPRQESVCGDHGRRA
jgi:hypothetical protein